MLTCRWPTARTDTSEPHGGDNRQAPFLRDARLGGWHMGAVRDLCCCGGFRVKWAMSEHALFKLVWPIQPYTSN